MPNKRSTVQFSSVPLAQRITSVSSDTRSRNAPSFKNTGTLSHATEMVAWLKSRAEAREKERLALVAQVAALDTQIQKDIDDAANWSLKAEKLAAKEAESSSIEDRFEEALRKKKEEETKPEETKPEEAEAEANDD
ncbi:hypothetical protein H9Q72_002175 [Fusarium xylarioides]|uniref:Uncharacterized protein n=1 Tax=Fusarium xylarioides TaxID=221167 RepID=A0A9P7LDM6_9HYPO|nr:hypothetical protein H9Q72_002175 [Fusarium xylarioides]